LVVWGQKTSLRPKIAFSSLAGISANSPTERVNVRLLTNYLKKVVTASSQYLLFDQNDRYLWDEWKRMIMPIMDNVQSKRGVYEYLLVMDETTVTPEHIDTYECPGKILFKPTRAAEFITLEFVMTPTGASFEQI
jgi:hypothetical protein